MSNKVIPLSEEPFRILQKLCETDPTTEAYSNALHNLDFLLEVLPHVDRSNLEALTQLSRVVAGQELPLVRRDEAPGPDMTEAMPDETPTPKPQAAQEKGGAGTLTKVQLREELAQLSNKHTNLNVAAIMAEMGYQKLSEVPAERYEELRGKVLAVVGGAA